MIPLVCCRPRTHQPHTMKYFGCTSARMRERRRHQPHSPGSLAVEKASKKGIPRIWLWTSQPRTRRVLYCTDMSLRLLSPLPHSNLLRSASVDSASLCSQVGATVYSSKIANIGNQSIAHHRALMYALTSPPTSGPSAGLVPMASRWAEWHGSVSRASRSPPGLGSVL